MFIRTRGCGQGKEPVAVYTHLVLSFQGKITKKRFGSYRGEPSFCRSANKPVDGPRTVNYGTLNLKNYFSSISISELLIRFMLKRIPREMCCTRMRYSLVCPKMSYWRKTSTTGAQDWMRRTLGTLWVPCL